MIHQKDINKGKIEVTLRVSKKVIKLNIIVRDKVPNKDKIFSAPRR